MEKLINQIALILVILGGLNWGIIGLVDSNIIKILFSTFPLLERSIYIIVGIASLWVAYTSFVLELK